MLRPRLASLDAMTFLHLLMANSASAPIAVIAVILGLAEDFLSCNACAHVYIYINDAVLGCLIVLECFENTTELKTHFGFVQPSRDPA